MDLWTKQEWKTENPDLCFSFCPWLALVIICICRAILKLPFAWLYFTVEVSFEMGDTGWRRCYIHIWRERSSPCSLRVYNTNGQESNTNGQERQWVGKWNYYHPRVEKISLSLGTRITFKTSKHNFTPTKKWGNSNHFVQGKGVLFLLLYCYLVVGSLELLFSHSAVWSAVCFRPPWLSIKFIIIYFPTYTWLWTSFTRFSVLTKTRRWCDGWSMPCAQ